MQIRKTGIILHWDSTPAVILIITLKQFIVFSVFLLKIMKLFSRWLLFTKLQNFYTILKKHFGTDRCHPVMTNPIMNIPHFFNSL